MTLVHFEKRKKPTISGFFRFFFLWKNPKKIGWVGLFQKKWVFCQPCLLIQVQSKLTVKQEQVCITMLAIHPSPSSQIIQAVGRTWSPASASPNEWNLANATRTAIPVEDRTKAWTILDIPMTDKRTWTKVQPGPMEQNYPTQNKNCAYNMKTPLEMIPKSSPKTPWRTTRNKNKEHQMMSQDHSKPSGQIAKVKKEGHAQRQPPKNTE